MVDKNKQGGYKLVRKPDWYFGGLAGSGAAIFTHPLDLTKVHMQTRKDKYISTFKVAKEVVAKEGEEKELHKRAFLGTSGPLGLYNGLSASILRQMTYSTARFGVYEHMKSQFPSGHNITLLESLGMAATGGIAGSIVGNPGDLINVRMQNDVKLPKEQRRKHAFHGLYSVATKEGVLKLWAGMPVNALRSAGMNIGQITFYAQCKGLMLNTGYFENNVFTHVLSSIIAGIIATILTLPIDVLKTRAMNAELGEPTGIITLAGKTAMEGPLAFFKGFMPSLIRMIPQTVLTFVIFEQLTKYFGVIVKVPIK